MENLAPLKLINGAPSALNDHSGPKWWLDLGVRVLFFGYSSKCATMVPTPCLVLHLKQEKCGLVLCVTKIFENFCLFAATKSLVLQRDIFFSAATIRRFETTSRMTIISARKAIASTNSSLPLSDQKSTSKVTRIFPVTSFPAVDVSVLSRCC